MQRTVAPEAAPGPHLGGKLMVDPGKKSEKRGVLQYVMAHFNRLLFW